MRWTVFPLSLLLTLGLVGYAPGEEYDTEGGINWFSDYDDEGVGTWDSGGVGGNESLGDEDEAFTGYESDDFGFDEGIYDDDTFENDDYGAYDSDYDWDTDDEWFDGWYGDADGLF